MANCGCTSILDGLDASALQAQLADMQQAYLLLVSGGKVQSASYTQADGSRSVSYTLANIADLVQAIKLVQKQLASLNGYCCNIRPPITPFF
ncbi:gpW family head-tail joining protein [Paraburkholderia sp. 35.1]|uniref:gpW family head-tail joining protein n=1 Tax=Paraburkholderia sp. 35.1 TaxID=2991058 RepID=UPI003D227885